MGIEREFRRRWLFEEAKRQVVGMEVDGDAMRRGLTTAARLRASVRRHVMRTLSRGAGQGAAR